MSENGNQPTTPETTPQPLATPAPTSDEWRAGPGSPFAGKTKEEILGIAQGQAYALQQANEMLQRFNQPVQEPQRNRFDLDIPDDEYVSGARLKQIVGQFANQPQPVDATARNLAAQSLYANIRQTRADEFKRWGSEIDAEIRKLDPGYWTYDALNIIVNMVRANHIDELAAEKAQRLLNESHPTIRSGTGGSSGGPQLQQSVFETGSPELLTRLRAANIHNEDDLRRVCAEIPGLTPESYLAEFQKFGKGAVIRG